MAIPAIATQSRMLGMLGRNDIIAGFIQFCKALYLAHKKQKEMCSF